MLRVRLRDMQITFSLILAFFAVVAAEDIYPNTKLYGMSGFAKKGNTTGGVDGQVAYIKNLKQLRIYISDAVTRTLVITENIHSSDKVSLLLGSSKSIIGSWKANYIYNVYFQTTPNSSNIIFQNLEFTHSPRNIENGDTQIILDHGERYWLDHCTFDGGHVNRNDLGKLLKVSTVNYVTISYCRFKKHEYGLILGYPSDNPADIDANNNLPQLTIMFNLFENLNARAPGLMRHGKFHVFNNLILNCHLGFTIGLNSKIYSEYNYFSDPKEQSEVLDDKGDGYFKDVGSISMPKKQTSKKELTWLPSSEYSYKAQTPDYSRDFCNKYSGSQSQKLNFDSDNSYSYNSK